MFIPTWIAPNVLTLAGFICVLIGHLVITYYDYYMDANTHYPSTIGCIYAFDNENRDSICSYRRQFCKHPSKKDILLNCHVEAAIPNWVWLFLAITFFAYYALDGMDGKQARRTGTSSPIGELRKFTLSFELETLPNAIHGCRQKEDERAWEKERDRRGD
ncbi:unnamed protein product [Anisakis simplex]|uniref:Palmitoyltransferase n=1 Tax=Anisakis simplex TaxID=6269 RepID=A0A0M3KBV8_ANISI|nr:unnamed protein product [Anisakis simplex]